VVVGRLQQRTWTAEDGSARSVVEVLADELGPSLRWGDGGGDQDDGERGAVASSTATGVATGGHLSRQFCLAYGESPYGYLMTRRIERAMALLRRGDRSVTEACFLVGCASLGSLSSRFTELVGMPPGAYRRQAARATAGMLSCVAKQVTRPGQKSRSAGHRAAASVTAMDITIHASFLPHDDPSAAGQAHSKRSFIARGRSSNGRWSTKPTRRRKQCRRDDDSTPTSQPN